MALFRPCFLLRESRSAVYFLQQSQVAPFLVRHYAKGKKGKSVQALMFDPEIAEGVVNLEKVETNMKVTVEKLRQEFTSKLTTRISPVIFDSVKVSTPDGKKVPINRLGHIQMSKDSFRIDMTYSSKEIKSVVSAINEAGLNLVPTVEGKTIRVPMPRMTQEYREVLLKIAKNSTEQARLGIRRIRQQGMNDVKKRKGGVSEDDIKMIEKQIQALTDQHVKTVDEMLQTKTYELLRK